MQEHPLIRNWLIVIAVILLVVVMGVTSQGRAGLTVVENVVGTVFSPVQGALLSASNYVAETTFPLRNVLNIHEENEALRAALLKTQRKLIDQTMLQEEYNDLKSLRKALNYAYRNNIHNYITADVIARDAENWYGLFSINIGSEDGVTENAMVFNGAGLIGQVYKVGEHRSDVLAITDVRGAVSFRIVDEVRNFDGIASGTSQLTLSGYLFDEEAEVFEGDQLITSGLGIYPKGIVIGTVSEVGKDEETLLKTVVVTPAVDFKTIDRVFVIPAITTIEE